MVERFAMIFGPNNSVRAKGSRALHRGLSMSILLSGLIACATDDGDSTTIPDRYTAFLKYPYPEFRMDTTPTTLTTKQVQAHPGNQSFKTTPIKVFAGVTRPPGAANYFLITHSQQLGYVLFKFGTDTLSPKEHLEQIQLVLDECYEGKADGRSWTSRRQQWTTCLKVGSIDHKTHGSLTVEGRTNDTGQLEFQIQMIDYRQEHVIQSQDINRLLLTYDEFETLIKILIEVSHPDILENK